MPRKSLIRTHEHPYHLRGRSNNKEWYGLPLDYCFAIYKENLELARKRYGIKIHAFVLMNNHFHLIASTPHQNLDSAMHFFMSATSRRIRSYTDRVNHVYGGRYKWSVISSAEYYRNCFRYVAQNPMRAKLVGDVRDWEYSTFSTSSASRILLDLPNGHDYLLPGTQELIPWLNKAIPDEHIKILRNGLMRPIFTYGRDRRTREPIKFLD